MRVLLVEDDARLAATVQQGLGEKGFVTVLAGDADEALAAVRSGGFDVLVLDVMLPGGRDGFRLASELRAQQVATPILMLTGRDAVEDRIRGLEAGADDYLLKPFAFAELVARLRALGRRHLPERSATLRAGQLSLDTSRMEVRVDDRPVIMTAKELVVLELFLLHPGQVLNRDQVLEHAWEDGDELAHAANTVDVFVGRIRRKLVASGMADPITTVRGIGYRLDVAPG